MRDQDINTMNEYEGGQQAGREYTHVSTCTAQRVDFVHKNDGGDLVACHLEHSLHEPAISRYRGTRGISSFAHRFTMQTEDGKYIYLFHMIRWG